MGRWKLHVEQSGYLPYETTEDVRAGELGTITLYLKRIGVQVRSGESKMAFVPTIHLPDVMLSESGDEDGVFVGNIEFSIGPNCQPLR